MNKEILINGYLKIEPMEHQSFMLSQKETFEEIGRVVAKDDNFPEIRQIPIGATVYFDSFMAKKYPVAGEEGKFQWFIHFNEITKYESEE